MASVDANIGDIGDFDHRVIMNVRFRILRRFYIRMWLAKQLFRIAAWLLKADLNVEME